MGLTLARALRLGAEDKAEGVTAFVGAGGKTTAMFQLGRELPPAVLTATTHLGAWQAPLADRHVVAADLEAIRGMEPRGVTLVTGPAGPEERLGPVSEDVLLWLHDICRRRSIPLLIEADGARQKPLKAPAQHEPAIPSFATLVVVVAGLAGLDKPLSAETVHRPERFAALSGLAPGQRVAPEALVQVLAHPEGGRKNIPPGARRVVLLNQADTGSVQSQARGMAQQLLHAFDAVIAASLQEQQIHAVYERAAGIVLAAGASERFGRPKQLLDWRGQPFVRVVASSALEAGLSPVVVVLGANAAEVRPALEGLPVQLVVNGGWQEGQASSIRTGVVSLAASVGSAVFLLADQPQVKFDVIAALADEHAAGLHPIVAPLVMMERRANPVLFDRTTFPDLLALKGDVGGRAVFSKHRVEYLPWHDDRLLLDVDTEADYRRLVEDDTL